MRQTGLELSAERRPIATEMRNQTHELLSTGMIKAQTPMIQQMVERAGEAASNANRGVANQIVGADANRSSAGTRLMDTTRAQGLASVNASPNNILSEFLKQAIQTGKVDPGMAISAFNSAAGTEAGLSAFNSQQSAQTGAQAGQLVGTLLPLLALLAL